LPKIDSLNKENSYKWGGIRQLMSGKIVADTLSENNLDPVFGALLNPTGSIVGAGNRQLIKGKYYNDAIVMHSICHDAAGYLYNYHDEGPGYNYLDFGVFPTSYPLAGQVIGILYWYFVVENKLKDFFTIFCFFFVFYYLLRNLL